MKKKDKITHLEALNDFTVMVSRHEQDVINGKIQVTNLKEYNDFRNQVIDLVKCYNEIGKKLNKEDVMNNIAIQNSEKYLVLLSKTIQSLEDKYENEIYEQDLPILMSKIRLICESNYVKNTSEEILVKNIFGEEQYNETSSLTKYNNLRKEVKILNILIEGKQDDITKLYQKQDDEITRHRKEMFEYLLVIMTPIEWEEFKSDILTTEKNYDKIILRLKEMGISIHNPKNEQYLELLSNCIRAIEIKYNNQINRENLPTIMEQIAIMCKYKDIELSMKIIEAQSEPSDRVYTIQDYFKEKHYILEAYKKDFKILVVKQGELYESYLEARAFIFNESYEEKETRDKMMRCKNAI